jgi:hypothetical protein
MVNPLQSVHEIGTGCTSKLIEASKFSTRTLFEGPHSRRGQQPGTQIRARGTLARTLAFELAIASLSHRETPELPGLQVMP